MENAAHEDDDNSAALVEEDAENAAHEDDENTVENAAHEDDDNSAALVAEDAENAAHEDDENTVENAAHEDDDNSVEEDAENAAHEDDENTAALVQNDDNSADDLEDTTQMVQKMVVQDESSFIVEKDAMNTMLDMTITTTGETSSSVIVEKDAMDMTLVSFLSSTVKKVDETERDALNTTFSSCTTNETSCSSIQHNDINHAQTNGDYHFPDDATQEFSDDDSMSTIHNEDDEKSLNSDEKTKLVNKRSVRNITETKLESIFEPEPSHHKGKNFLSSSEISMIGLPKTLSRDPMVLVQQLKKILQSVQNIRPLTPRETLMPGLKNFVGNSRNVKNKKVRNVCYFNALVFALSSCDSIVEKALSYLKSINPSWAVNVDLLQHGRKKPKSGTSVAPLIGREESRFVENFSNLLVAMRAQDLPRIFEETINYKEDRLILDPTFVLTSFYKESDIPEKKQGI